MTVLAENIVLAFTVVLGALGVAVLLVRITRLQRWTDRLLAWPAPRSLTDRECAENTAPLSSAVERVQR